MSLCLFHFKTNNRKCEDRMYIYRDTNMFQLSGGGFYNNLGQKSGCWRTLSKNFWDLSQVIYQGQYENGQKIGKLDINWKIPQGINVFEQIGGGSFNEKNMKNGIWVEVCDGFLEQQINYSQFFLVTTNLYLVVNI
ncbi:unnamed protein product [Paramecium sonneborni]|uniref:Uncharacterized protein n=1 Tax=Paramecium sonneborni TaxID=65129 RepID=A0A8S1RNK2_9CILI|nr:unnamed protein product [Paramecium sonneborni]